MAEIARLCGNTLSAYQDRPPCCQQGISICLRSVGGVSHPAGVGHQRIQYWQGCGKHMCECVRKSQCQHARSESATSSEDPEELYKQQLKLEYICHKM